MNIGDCVVPIPFKEAWEKDSLSYVRIMKDTYIGMTGCIENVCDLQGYPYKGEGPPCFEVHFNSGDCRYYLKKWVRLATPEEVRIYKFIRAIKK